MKRRPPRGPATEKANTAPHHRRMMKRCCCAPMRPDPLTRQPPFHFRPTPLGHLVHSRRVAVAIVVEVQLEIHLHASRHWANI